MVDKLSPHRPLRVTLLALGVLSLAIFHWIALVQCLIEWGLLTRILPFTPAVIVMMNLLWGAVGLVLAWGLWSGRSWAARLTRWGSLVYLLYLWVVRMLLYSSEGRGENTLFIAIFSVLSVLVVLWVLSSRKVKFYFGEAHER
jgi:hypothetical protein